MLNDYMHKLNNIQRAGVFLWVLSIIALLALHNPIGGYYKFTYNVWDNLAYKYYIPSGGGEAQLLTKCRAVLDQVTSEDWIFPEKSKIVSEIRRLGCEKDHLLPISAWRSLNPILPWFGGIANLLWGLFLSSVSFLSFLFLFKDADKK